MFITKLYFRILLRNGFLLLKKNPPKTSETVGEHKVQGFICVFTLLTIHTNVSLEKRS